MILSIKSEDSSADFLHPDHYTCSFVYHFNFTESMQQFRRIELIVHIAIAVLSGTHLHLSQMKHVRVECLAQGHNIRTIIPAAKGGDPKFSNIVFSLLIIYLRGLDEDI